VKVLVVDDQPANLLAVEVQLAGLGLNLVKAGSGFEALRLLLGEDFALILMDVKMPGMDGLEAAGLIRQRRRCRGTPIIFLTASEADEAQVSQGYALGAVDYLVKPVVEAALRSKVSVFVDIFRKTEQVKRQADLLLRLEQREHQRQLAEAKERGEAQRLREEMRIARQVQQRLFPATPPSLPGLDIAGASIPAEATGGDYFDYIPTPDGGLAVAIGDVCGHGIGPAMVMAQLRAYLRAFLATRADLGEVLGLLSRTLGGDTDRFVTFLLTKIDPVSRSLTYVGAGHLPGYVLGREGEVRARLESNGVPLAILPDAEYTTEPAVALRPGEMALLLTDGIAEARGPGGAMFGTDRALRVVRANRHRPAGEALDALYAAVGDFCGQGPQLDDMTAVVIKAEER
jgi:phosphoserine phosphatase RsbU/P